MRRFSPFSTQALCVHRPESSNDLIRMAKKLSPIVRAESQVGETIRALEKIAIQIVAFLLACTRTSRLLSLLKW
jgi:hypothetical protein